MTRITDILFDKDGTLLDFNRTWIPPYLQAAAFLSERFGGTVAADALLRQGGFNPDDETWQSDSLLASGSNREIFDFWSELLGEPIEGDDRRAVEGIFALQPEHYIPVRDDLGGLMTSLVDRGVRLGLATMDNESSAHHALDALGITDAFDFVCGADSGHGIKPEPGMVDAFCRDCDLLAGEVVMVGDSPKDLNMGRNAGVALSVGVLTGAHDHGALAPFADLVMPDITGLMDLLG